MHIKTTLKQLRDHLLGDKAARAGHAHALRNRASEGGGQDHSGDGGEKVVNLLTRDGIQQALHRHGPYLRPRPTNPAERRGRPRPMGLRVGSCWSWHGLEELTDEAHFAALQHCRRALLGLRLNAVLGGPARQRASKLIGAHTRSRTAGYQAFSFTLLRCQGAQQVGAAARLALRFTRVEPTDPVRDKRRAWLRSAAATQRVFRTLRMPRGPGTCGRKAHARAGASTSTWLCCAQPGRSRGGGPDGGLSTPSSMEVANGNRRRGGCVHGAAGVCAGLGGSSDSPSRGCSSTTLT